MLIVTAFNKAYQRLGDNCCESLRRHCARYPDDRWQHYHIPADFGYAASWYKINVINDALSQDSRVLWIDADAMIVGSRPFDVILGDATLNIARDDNGVNCGVMAWKQNEQAFGALTRLLALREEYKDHIWWEQAALQSFIGELSVHYPEKRVFNAYQEDRCEDTQILHIPGLHIHERTMILEEALQSC